MQPLRGRGLCDQPLFPGCAARPRALRYNPFGVGEARLFSDGKLPRLAVRPAQHRRGFLVVDDRLLHRVPLDLPPGADGDVAQVADRRRAVADFDVADRRLPALDAVQPVAVVVAAGVQPHVLVGQRLLQNLRRVRRDLAPVDVDRALLADERRAAGLVVAADHLHAVGVGVNHFHPLRHLVPVVLVVAGPGLGLDRAAVVHAEAPLGDVQVVGAEVGHLPAGVVPEEAEQVVDVLGVVRLLRRGAEPEVVVQLRRRVAVGHGRAGEVDAGDADLDGGDLAELAVADQLAGLAELLGGALLAAGLDDAVVLAGCLDHRPPLGDGQAERLLAVDVLAGLAGVDGDQGVPVVGHGDDDGIDVLAVEQLAVVADGERGLAGLLLDAGPGLFEPGLIDLADRDAVLDVDAEVAFALVADADAADADSFAGRVGGEAGGDQGRQGRGQPQGGALAQEVAARRRTWFRGHGGQFLDINGVGTLLRVYHYNAMGGTLFPAPARPQCGGIRIHKGGRPGKRFSLATLSRSASCGSSQT